MKHLGHLLSVITWLLVAGSVVILTGGIFGRPLLLAAVPSGSMIPVLHPGDLIVVLPTWAMSPPGLGDIIVFKTPKDQDWVVHRIIDGNSAEGFVTKGDANPISDSHRVFPKDVAGVVPQRNGKALHLSRLGLLSIEAGPISSPIVAGAALLMGVYLLVLDLKPKPTLQRIGRARPARARPEAILALYLGLAGTAFLTTLIPAWTLSTRTLVEYEVVFQRSTLRPKLGQYVLGQRFEEAMVVENPSILPVVVVFSANDPNVHFTPTWSVVKPRSKRHFEIVVDNQDLGTHQAFMHMGVFLPVIPPALQGALGQQSSALTALLTALVPALAVLIIATLDVRSRVAWARWRTKLVVRFM